MVLPILVIGLVTLVATLEFGAISCLKLWAPSKKWWYMAGAIALYIMVAVGLGYSLTLERLAIVNATWQVLAIIIVTLIAVIYFKEPLAPMEWGGIGVIVAGFVLLMIGGLGKTGS